MPPAFQRYHVFAYSCLPRSALKQHTASSGLSRERGTGAPWGPSPTPPNSAAVQHRPPGGPWGLGMGSLALLGKFLDGMETDREQSLEGEAWPCSFTLEFLCQGGRESACGSFSGGEAAAGRSGGAGVRVWKPFHAPASLLVHGRHMSQRSAFLRQGAQATRLKEGTGTLSSRKTPQNSPRNGSHFSCICWGLAQSPHCRAGLMEPLQQT